MTIGRKIQHLRKEKRMSQGILAAHLNVGNSFLSMVENDQKSLKRSDLKTLSELFKVKLSELETLWLANKIYGVIRDENQGLDALKVAEEQAKYSKKK